MSYYLDANVLIALLIPEELSARAEGFLDANLGMYFVSNLAAAEVASAISRRVRTAETTASDARLALSSFDEWLERSAQWVELEAADIANATTFLRRLDLALLTPDAIHIAAVQRLDGTLVTFDRQLAASARVLGCQVAEP